MREILRDLLTLAAGAAAAAILLWSGLATQPEPATVLRGSVSSLPELAGFAASAAGLVLALWWVLGLLVAVLAAVLQKAGHAAAAAAAGTLAPAFMRRLAAAALGLHLIVGLATPANAGVPLTVGNEGQGVSRLQEGQGPETAPQLNPALDRAADGSSAADIPASPHWKPRLQAGANVLVRPGREQLPAAATRVVVQSGDSLWSLAAAQLGPLATDERIAAHWPRWYERNRAVIGDRPELILPGQVLEAPDVPEP